MENKDIITAIGIILTFIVGSSGLFISIRNSKKTQFINTVTSSRIKWIGELRELTSIFLSHIMLCTEPHFREPGKDRGELNKKLTECSHKIRLYLNYKDKRDIDIINMVDSLVFNAFALSLNLNLYTNSINSKSQDTDTIIAFTSVKIASFCSEIIPNTTKELTEKIQEYLKEEWERVKKEAKIGDLANALEKRNWKTIKEMKHFYELKNWSILGEIYDKSLTFKLKFLILIAFIIIFIA